MRPRKHLFIGGVLHGRRFEFQRRIYGINHEGEKYCLYQFVNGKREICYVFVLAGMKESEALSRLEKLTGFCSVRGQRAVETVRF